MDQGAPPAKLRTGFTTGACATAAAAAAGGALLTGRWTDPVRIRLPRGRVLESELLASFEKERQRIDNLLGNQGIPTEVASTN